MTVRRLLEEIDSPEITAWQAWDRIAPLDGIERLETAIARLGAVLANQRRNPNADPYSVDDFKVDYTKRPDPPPTPEQMETKMDNCVSALGVKWMERME